MQKEKQYTVVLCEFNQESNSFNPEITEVDSFEYYGIYEEEELVEKLEGEPRALTAMLDTLREHQIDILPVCSMYSQSGGRVNHALVIKFIDKVIDKIEKHGAIDGVFLSLHGATQSTECDDVCGLILSSIRAMIHADAVISVSLDLHANVTEKMMVNSDYLCGFHTYPHVDYYQTGKRAAILGINKIVGTTIDKMVRIGIPMIVPANAYSTLDGDFKSLMEYAKREKIDREITDFSIFMMQPWLNVSEASSTVVVIAEDVNKAETFALDIAERLYQLRDRFTPELYSVAEVIHLAKENISNKPVILADCADSSNAGASGDGVAVLDELLSADIDFKAATVLSDVSATDYAHQLGAGESAIFKLGGTVDSVHQKSIQAEATVVSLHDGIFAQEGPAGKGIIINIGQAAVLEIGNIKVLVCHKLAGNGDLQLYRAFGIKPEEHKLLVVKACTSFKVAYEKIAHQICQTQTPGAATSNLKSLDYNILPKPFYPFDSIDGYDFKDKTIGYEGK